MTIFRRIGAPPVRETVQQELEDDDIPVDDVPVVVDIPVVGHGDVLPNVEIGGVLGITRVGGGLRPPAPSSVDPSGIPTRPTDDAEPIPVGDEADAAGPANELLPVVGQVPDAVPVTPPPSKTEVEPEVPAVDVPVIPVIELPMPDIVPTVEPPVPKEVCGIETPMPAHCATMPVPDVDGLTPGDASSVAPRGTPVGATGEAGPMPSGDVMPSGGEVPVAPTCAEAEPKPKSAAVKSVAVVTAVANRIMLAVSCIDCARTWRPYATLR
jgi:hypothetical protein